MKTIFFEYNDGANPVMFVAEHIRCAYGIPGKKGEIKVVVDTGDNCNGASFPTQSKKIALLCLHSISCIITQCDDGGVYVVNLNTGMFHKLNADNS